MRNKPLTSLLMFMTVLLSLHVIVQGTALAMPLQTMAPITGEIQAIVIDRPADPWSSGNMTIGGQVIYLPANMLINLPNDYQSLQQLYVNAPAACKTTGETGLAKGDRCNARATGSQATIVANRNEFGNVIAGQVDIFKGLDTAQGAVTYINTTDGYFRLNGDPASPSNTGVMVRVNDPTSRNTVQSGLGCAAGTPNCSPDVRFKIDPDNYTFCYITGFPACVQTTTDPGNSNCPDINRPPIAPILSSGNFGNPPVAGDSRHFAPIKVGDPIKADGSFETIGGVTFLSAWSVRVMVDLTTNTVDPTQPNYLIINAADWDGPAYPAGRVRGRLLTNSTFHTVTQGDEIDFYSIHYDPVNNAPHERILYTTRYNKQFGPVFFNVATGVSDSQIRYDFFPGAPTPAGGKPAGQEPCASLRGTEPKFGVAGVTPATLAADLLAIGVDVTVACPDPTGLGLADNFNLMTPVFREVMARSTRSEIPVGAPGHVTGTAVDIHGSPAQSGFYKLPTTIAYGAFEDINLGMGQFPVQFSGNPWLRDRRLSPNGCLPAPVGCESLGANPIGTLGLNPFPYEGIDPLTVAPTYGFVVAGLATSLPVPNHWFTYMTALGSMTGILPPAPPANVPVGPLAFLAVQPLNIFPPLADEDFATTTTGRAVIIPVLANDYAPFGTLDPATVKIVTGPASGTAVVNGDGTITYTPTIPFSLGSVSFTYTVANNFGAVSLPGTVNVTITSTFSITSAAAPNGAISPAGVTTVTSNTNQTYTITPNVGFTVANLLVDGILLPGATTYTFTNVSADHFINAYFTNQSFTVTASAGANGAITPTGTVAALYGTSSNYTITPNLGFQIANLVVDGVTLPAAPSYDFTNITGNHTISAAFTNNFTVTASASPSGTITPAGVSPVTGGSNKTYTITPNAGLVVISLVVDGVTLPGATTYSFTNVTANHTISAVFGTPPIITASAATGGTISPAGATTLTAGTNQTYTITPNAGFLVTNLLVDGTLLPGATSYTFNNVTASHYINAYFGPVPATVTIVASAGTGGIISPAGTNVVAGGSSPAFTITPNAGFLVSNLLVDGTLLPGATSYSFPNVTVSHYINAYFGPVPTTVTITAAAGPGGAISPSGANAVAGGSSPIFTITPNAGLTISALVVDGVLQPAAPTFTFTNVSTDHYINAYFQ